MSFMRNFVPYALTVGFLSIISVQDVYSQEYTPDTCEFGGRVGRVIVKNDSLYPINVKMYHSDTGRMHSAHKVQGGRTVDVGYNAGDSWGIQLGGSPIKCLGSVAQWRNNTFYVNTTTFYNQSE